MEVFSKYNSYLQQFDYPNITSVSDDQIANIFSAENRRFLLVWLAKILNSQFVEATDWSDSAKEELADFFYESGFCTSSQKNLFLTGDVSLNIKEQVNIFDRIFYRLEYTSYPEENNDVSDSKSNNNNEDLELFIKMDLNLLPNIGSPKFLTSEEKQWKLEYYKEKIQDLTEKLQNVEMPETEDTVFDTRFFVQEVIDKNIEKLHEQAKQLKEVCSALNKRDTYPAVQPEGFNCNIGKQLAGCDAELTSVLQYFKDINLTEHLNAGQELDSRELEQSEIAKRVNEHAELTSTIVKSIKEADD